MRNAVGIVYIFGYSVTYPPALPEDTVPGTLDSSSLACTLWKEIYSGTDSMWAGFVFPPGALKVAGGARGALALFPIPFFQIGKFTRFARKLTKTHILFRMRPILLPPEKDMYPHLYMFHVVFTPYFSKVKSYMWALLLSDYLNTPLH